MILPITPKLPDLRPESFKWLIMGGSGMGKSSLFASIPKILVIDPDNGMAALPLDFEPLQVRNWTDCLSVLKLLKQAKPEELLRYSWIGLDLANVMYEFAYNHECSRMGVSYPSDLEGGKARGKGWAIITKTYISWLRELGTLGLPLIATCHVNLVEVSVKNRTFQRAIPGFPGGSATSVFQRVKESFDIVGYLTFDLVPTDAEKDQRKVLAGNVTLVDVPKHQQIEATNTRVIHFQPSQYWDAQDTSRQLPEKVILPTEWEQDWSTIQQAWRWKANESAGNNTKA